LDMFNAYSINII